MKNKVILVTGGAGSFGQKFIEHILKQDPKMVIVYSRDSYKHWLMEFGMKDRRVVYVVGNVRDKERLTRSLQNVDIVIHAAAFKDVYSCEENPIEAVKTNVMGTAVVIEACLDSNVERMVFISTDKAVDPVSLYGATKLTAERLVIQANNYKLMFSVVRLGNIMGSTGSVLPLFKILADQGKKSFPITDERMTRFWFTDQYCATLVCGALQEKSGLILVGQSASFRIVDLALAYGAEHFDIIGATTGEKIHEILIGDYEIPYNMRTYSVLVPVEKFTDYSEYMKKVTYGPFSSEQGTFLEVDEIKKLIGE